MGSVLFSSGWTLFLLFLCWAICTTQAGSIERKRFRSAPDLQRTLKKSEKSSTKSSSSKATKSNSGSSSSNSKSTKSKSGSSSSKSKSSKSKSSSNESCDCPTIKEERPRFQELDVEVNLVGATSEMSGDTVRTYERTLKKALKSGFSIQCPDDDFKVISVEVTNQDVTELSFSYSFGDFSRRLGRSNNRADTKIRVELDEEPSDSDTETKTKKSIDSDDDSSSSSDRRRVLNSKSSSKSSSTSKSSKSKSTSQSKSSDTCRIERTFLDRLQDSGDSYFDEVEAIEAIVTDISFFSLSYHSRRDFFL